MSGGGRCNFVNKQVEPCHFIGQNPHFVKSALSKYQPEDFIDLVNRHHIAHQEREHGQLFCKNSAKDILSMLLNECHMAGVDIHLKQPSKIFKQLILIFWSLSNLNLIIASKSFKHTL